MAGAVHHELRRLLLLLGLVCLASTARADTVVLKNGVTHKGAVRADTDTEVVILADGLEWTFRKDQVRSVTRDQASADRELTALKKRREAQARAEKERARASQERLDREFVARHVERKTPPPAKPATTTTAAYAARPAGGVVVYSTSWCGFCKKAKAYFRSKNVAFVDKDIEADPDADAEMKRKCAKNGVRAGGVPVLDVYGTLIAGFDVPRIDAALSRR